MYFITTFSESLEIITVEGGKVITTIYHSSSRINQSITTLLLLFLNDCYGS